MIYDDDADDIAEDARLWPETWEAPGAAWEVFGGQLMIDATDALVVDLEEYQAPAGWREPDGSADVAGIGGTRVIEVRNWKVRTR